MPVLAVKVGLRIVEGTASVTVMLLTVLGPLLVTSIVYSIGEPGVAVVCPSVLLMLKSAVVTPQVLLFNVEYMDVVPFVDGL